MSTTPIDFGLTPQEFRERHLEKTCYARKAALRVPAFTWADLDDILYQVEPTAPALQLFHEGLIPEEVYTEPAFELGLRRRRLNPSRFYAQMAGGATLVMNRVEAHSARLRRLCAEVARFMGHQTLGNAYVAFGGNGTFGQHWDTHDVVVLQLIGRKRWQIFGPTFPQPLSSHTTRNVGHECPPTPVHDCVLEAGDLLYIPRGWWHHAMPLQEGSFHLSVGVYVPSVLDYLMWVCSHHVSKVVEARNGVLDPTLDKQSVAAALQALQEAATNPFYFAQFQREVAERGRSSPELDVTRNLARSSSSTYMAGIT
jgi:ribosomal protein L16 Arg81 hydroxylase